MRSMSASAACDGKPEQQWLAWQVASPRAPLKAATCILQVGRRLPSGPAAAKIARPEAQVCRNCLMHVSRQEAMISYQDTAGQLGPSAKRLLPPRCRTGSWHGLAAALQSPAALRRAAAPRRAEAGPRRALIVRKGTKATQRGFSHSSGINSASSLWR
jgi:hypothetical protein